MSLPKTQAETTPRRAKKQILLAAILPLNPAQPFIAHEPFVTLTVLAPAIVTVHQRVIHTNELFCQGFALMSYLDHNEIMEGNTPKISVGTKAGRQC